MMDTIIEAIRKMDIAQLIAIGSMFLFFYKRHQHEMNEVAKEVKEIKTQVIDMDKRLFAIETMLHMKDCCMLKDNQMKKVDHG
jgi:hypothetical protein